MYLIEEVIRLGVRNKVLSIVHRVRVCLKVRTLSDITSAHDTHINKE